MSATFFSFLQVLIPDYVWKIVVTLPPGNDPATNRITTTNRVIVVKIPITNDATNAWPSYVTSTNQIQVDTGFTFFTALPANVAAIRKSRRRESGNAVFRMFFGN